MLRPKLIIAAALLASGTGTVVAAHNTLKGIHYAGEARVSLTAARASALKTRPGIITDQELERERGGSGLRYSFDIKAGSKTYEVGIDAKTGAVLENSTEGAHPD